MLFSVETLRKPRKLLHKNVPHETVPGGKEAESASSSLSLSLTKQALSPTVPVVRNDPLNPARRTLIEESIGCEDDQTTLRGA
jgi:hypothetical protein